MASSLAYLPSDMFVYDVGNDELTVHEDLKSTLGECLGCSSLYVCVCVCVGGGGMCYGASPTPPHPSATTCGYALRATIDPAQDEMYIFTVSQTAHPDQIRRTLMHTSLMFVGLSWPHRTVHRCSYLKSPLACLPPLPFSNLKSPLTCLPPLPFSSLKSPLTSLPPLPFSSLKSPLTCLPPLPFSSLKSPLTCLPPLPFSSLKSPLTSLPPLPFSSLKSPLVCLPPLPFSRG